MIEAEAILKPAFQPVQHFAEVRNGELQRILWDFPEEMAMRRALPEFGVVVVLVEIRQVPQNE